MHGGIGVLVGQIWTVALGAIFSYVAEKRAGPLGFEPMACSRTGAESNVFCRRVEVGGRTLDTRNIVARLS